MTPREYPESDPEFDEFATGSGLKSDYDGEVVDAWFTTDPSYNNGKSLILKLKKKDVADQSESEDFYPCGNDWGSFDGGETAEHPKGKTHPFNKNSGVAALMNAAFAAGAEEEIRRRSAEEFGRLGLRAAGIWKGLVFHWSSAVEKFTMTDRTVGSPTEGQKIERTSTRILPTKFLGIGGTSTTPSSPATTAPTATGVAASSPAGTGDPLSLVSAETSAKIKVLATALDYSAWIDQCMALPGVIDAGTVLLEAIGDEAFYTNLKG